MRLTVSRVRQLLDELIAKLGREIESHLNYLRGNLWAALDLGRIRKGLL